MSRAREVLDARLQPTRLPIESSDEWLAAPRRELPSVTSRIETAAADRRSLELSGSPQLRDMTVLRIDNALVVVEDLRAAAADNPKTSDPDRGPR